MFEAVLTATVLVFSTVARADAANGDSLCLESYSVNYSEPFGWY